jgi:threonyl-tRNA synthetase
VRKHGQDGKGNITVSIDAFASLINEEVQKTLKTFEV